MPTQQQAPRKIGFPPSFTSFTTLLPRPMADIANTMKNLLNSFKGTKTEAGTLSCSAIVVITEATINQRINIGKALLKLNPFVCSLE